MTPETHDGEPVPFRGRGSWTPAARLAASDQMRQRLIGVSRTLDVAETGAEYLRELFTALTVTVSTLAEGRYRDLINVGYLPNGEVRYPDDCLYPEGMYPDTTQLLHSEGGYFTSDIDDPAFKEFILTMPESEATSVMGVSVVSGGVPRGEVCLTRGQRQPAFDREDFELARDLATTFGTRLMMALRRETK